MNTLLILQNRAIKAAQEERWADAQATNQEILEIDSENLSAMNRLGFTYLQQGELAKAKALYEAVLQRDRTNAVANKYLNVIAKDQPLALPKALKHSDFIDEPGKTRSVTLVRTAGPAVLETLSVGSDCQLSASKARISVRSGGVYIGTLPDDIYSRLLPLLEAGNTYSARIQSLKHNQVVIFVRELSRAASVGHIASFPSDNLGILALDTELARAEQHDALREDADDEDLLDDTESDEMDPEAYDLNE